MQVAFIVICLAATAVGVALFARTVAGFTRQYRLGQPEKRSDNPGARTVTLVREFLGHTRMAKLPLVAAAHWIVMVSFGFLFFTLLTAYGQLFKPTFALPLIGHWLPFEWGTEVLGWLMLLSIVVLMAIRQVKHPRRYRGEQGLNIASGERGSRFYGSSFWQAYYVELTILGVGVCIVALRGLEYALGRADGATWATALHFPLSAWLGSLFSGASTGALEAAIIAVATLKILVSMAWFVTVALNPTMGVAWHRFLAFFNIWFKRHADGKVSLGALQPMKVDGEPIDFENIEEMDEDAALGVGKIEDFTWKGLLDFSTCTECGRCQSQCPAWNTDKPLSPKLVILQLRDHANAKAPWLLASEEARGDLPADVLAAAERPLVGPTEGDPWRPTGGAVIDPDVLWSCTTCGACVEQCPVDIEHVDHIVDMRRNQVLIESAFPSELGGLFKNLEKNSNPWGMSPRKRLEWAQGLPFEVKQVGADVEDLSEVEYLFWVGCAGAFEDRAKKTTQAVAELLHTAGVDFAVLGDGEGCTGDPARRAGNEFLFQMLAQPNVETLNELKATKIVVTCAHCFNTISNEYPQLGGNYEVVHHTQLLNKLVRDKKLVPVAPPAGPVKGLGQSGAGASAPTVTYHDPCYLGRHNGVYNPPRELIGSLPGVEMREMERSRERSFCCGAGGARMWMEEKLGTRINGNRTAEAVATGADTIAIGCPFCRVMISDGLTAAQSEGTAREEVQVLDVAQMLLAAVKRGEEQNEPEAVAAP
ncbi:MAG TPA: (Fe-S)-binding protein [Actinomycetales bacterium]|nr:(Fe-S)-binding protein [Actinomycetales bacterium]